MFAGNSDTGHFLSYIFFMSSSESNKNLKKSDTYSYESFFHVKQLTLLICRQLMTQKSISKSLCDRLVPNGADDDDGTYNTN